MNQLFIHFGVDTGKVVLYELHWPTSKHCNYPWIKQYAVYLRKRRFLVLCIYGRICHMASF
jgi:hypothetical protein